MLNEKLHRLKTKIRTLTKYDNAFKITKGYNHEWYGNSYGGFYVHPNTLKKDSIVYSFGIGEDISFDKAIIEKHGCRVFGFDPTPKSIEWIKSQILPGGFSFMNYGLHVKTGFVSFHLPKNKNHVSGSLLSHQNVNDNDIVTVPVKKFTDITNELGHERIDLLKIDIEGSEYETLDSILASPIYIRQILLEIHERFFEDGRSKTRKLIKALKDNNYTLFAVSDSFEELSFIKIEP
ncbi:MAG TPA: FkbM family methyltransferase [Parafilimonas sp.]|nr:FkbM family methyltransferase [Parafilimonas sp.]